MSLSKSLCPFLWLLLQMEADGVILTFNPSFECK